MKRQPAKDITDRAKRYRANQDIPDGPKLCGFCGATRDLGVAHIDGYEEHGESENLIWLCRSCNQKQSAVFKAAGLGRRTQQYNPFQGLFKSIFGSKETYRLRGAGHPEERGKAAQQKRERLAAERREYVAEKKRERLEKGKPVTRFKGVTIYRSGADPDLPFYTSLDPDSRFETLRDAKAVIGHFRNPAESLSSWAGAVGILQGDIPASKADIVHAARVVRTTRPARRLSFLGELLKRNPGAQTMGAFVNALQIVKGLAPGDRKAAEQLIHDTSKSRRAAFQEEIWAIRKDRYGKSGRQGSFFEEVPF